MHVYNRARKAPRCALGHRSWPATGGGIRHDLAQGDRTPVWVYTGKNLETHRGAAPGRDMVGSVAKRWFDRRRWIMRSKFGFLMMALACVFAASLSVRAEGPPAWAYGFNTPPGAAAPAATPAAAPAPPAPIPRRGTYRAATRYLSASRSPINTARPIGFPAIMVRCRTSWRMGVRSP